MNKKEYKLYREKEFDGYELAFPKVKALASYLISLFYKSDCRYFCYRTKINRLLTIYKLCSAQFDPYCFSPLFVVDYDYMIIKYLNCFVDRDVYTTLHETDDKQEFTKDFNENAYIPEKYKIYENKISEKEKRILEIIFRKYGGYSICDLAPMLNELHHNIPFKKGVIFNKFEHEQIYLDTNEFLSFLNSEENQERYKDNEIFNFIRDFNNFTINDKSTHSVKTLKYKNQ